MQVIRRLVAAVVLLVVVIGAPVALWVFGRDRLPDHVPSGDEVRAFFTQRDDGSLFLGALVFIGVVAWLVFTMCVVVELAALAAGRSGRWRVPGLRVPQRAAAALVAAAFTTSLAIGVAAPAAAAGPAGPPPNLAVAVQQYHATPDRAPAGGAASVAGSPVSAAATPNPRPASSASTLPVTPARAAGTSATTWTVGRYDTLWRIAEHTLGDGAAYQRIVAANVGVVQADGRTLADADTPLEVGWVLRLPNGANPQAASTPPRPAMPATVTVRPGDTLSGIAEDRLGSADRYVELARINQLPDPDRLEVGQVLTLAPPLPPGRGDLLDKQRAAQHQADLERAAAAKHAADTRSREAVALAAALQRAADAQDTTLAADRHAAVVAGQVADIQAARPDIPTAAPAVRSTAPTAPASAQAPPDTGAEQDASSSSSVMPAFAVGAGAALLSGLAFAALMVGRRRQFRWRRPGRSIPATPSSLIAMERAVLTRGREHVADVGWLDEALRTLAQELARDSEARIPDVVAAKLTDESLELVLARPSLTAPDPWTVDDYGLRWTLARSAELPPLDRELSFGPLPALVSVGYTDDGQHWLIDLEMVGSLTLTGDRQRCMALARFMAAELAHNTWSEGLRATMVGFGAALVPANPARLVHTDHLGEALQTLRIQLDAVDEVEAQAHVDVAAGRLHNRAGDTWATEVVFVGTDIAADADDLAPVLQRLRTAPGRVAVAVVIQVADADENADATTGRWTVHVDADGTLRIPSLELQVHAEQLAESETADLAALLALATTTGDVPMPDAPGDRPWDAFIDAAGALHPELVSTPELSPVRLAADADARDDSVLPLPTHVYEAAAPVSADVIQALAPEVPAEIRARLHLLDPTLDDDLADWRDPHSSTPKVTVLGRLEVCAQGQLDPQRPRRSWNVEVVVYLAMSGPGVTAEQMAADLWPDEVDAHRTSKLRNAVTTARRWLGPNPRTGRDHLPTNSGVPGARYRLEDVLVDAELFRRLRVRAAARGPAGIDDLQEALTLVTGVPFSEQRPRGYGWLAGGVDHSYVGMITDAAHLVATHMLATDRPEEAMAAAQVALHAGAFGLDPLMDCAAACFARGLRAEGASYIRQMVTAVDGTDEEDLPSHIYAELLRQGWLAS